MKNSKKHFFNLTRKLCQFHVLLKKPLNPLVTLYLTETFPKSISDFLLRGLDPFLILPIEMNSEFPDPVKICWICYKALYLPICSSGHIKGCLACVLRIRIRMFLGLLDPHSDPLVTSTDPAPNPSIIKQK
jgi:hypothetical protein